MTFVTLTLIVGSDQFKHYKHTCSKAWSASFDVPDDFNVA
jgi:hypothetical protein